MFRITFEKVIIFVLILILIVSTANLSSQYIKLWFSDKKPVIAEIEEENPRTVELNFLISEADIYLKANMYDKASRKYDEIILNYSDIMSIKQKYNTTFRYGICYFKLGDYQKAYESFLKAIEYNPEDALTYNNAAISAFYNNDLTNAQYYIQRAVDTLSVVEYYYNMGRIYEAEHSYTDAARAFLAVVKGEENISSADKIDPVRLKNKIQNLIPDQKIRDSIATDILISLKYKDDKDLLLVLDDTEMELKNTDFTIRTDKESGKTVLLCSFDKSKSDPYNLINTLEWTIKKDGRKLYSSDGDKLSYKASVSGKYEVSLDITYSGIKKKRSIKNISINNEQQSIVIPQLTPTASPTPPPKRSTKIYTGAFYEQLFEKWFELDTRGYTDAYNVVWGKDAVDTSIITYPFMDSGSSMLIQNKSSVSSGIWANLSTLLNDYSIRGRTVSVRFYARRVDGKENTNVTIRAGSERIISGLDFDNKWSMQRIDIDIPNDAGSFTFSMDLKPQHEIEIDGFNIVVIK